MQPSQTTRRSGERGAALIEAAMVIPLVLLVAVGIFEFGRAFETWQVLTNAAREGARLSVTPDATTAAVELRVRTYMQSGQLANYGSAYVSVNRSAAIPVGVGTAPASQVTVNYPFTFMVLQPVIWLVQPGSTAGAPLTMQASVTMRNESP